MSSCTLRLAGPATHGVRVAGPLLRDLLDTLVEAVQQSVRLRAEGKSRDAGPAPAWLEKATEFDIEIREGSTQLVLQAPALAEVVPDRFAQLDMFRAVNPGESCLDVFAEALDDALDGCADSDLYDDALVETFEGLGRIFRYDIQKVELVNGRKRTIERQSVDSLRQLRRQIPPSQRTKLAGKLDLLRHTNRNFALILGTGETVRGVIGGETAVADLGPLLGRDVIVGGLARFRPSGRILRIEADQMAAAEGDIAVWAAAPKPLLGELDTRTLRVSQGPKSGVSSIFGQWPGEETDEEFDAALRELS